jgi:HSF-type DNA-binding
MPAHNMNFPAAESAAMRLETAGEFPRGNHAVARGNDDASSGLACDFEFSRRKIFPERLFRMLDQVDGQGLSHIVGWQPHGRCFFVGDREAFVSLLPTLMPGITKWKSFLRNLRLWGFARLTYGPDIHSYFHQNFLRHEPHKLRCVRRTMGKGADFSESDYYALPFVVSMLVNGIPSRDERKRLGMYAYPEQSVAAATAREYPKKDRASGSPTNLFNSESTEPDSKLQARGSFALVNTSGLPQVLSSNKADMICGTVDAERAFLQVIGSGLAPDLFPPYCEEKMSASRRSNSMIDPCWEMGPTPNSRQQHKSSMTYPADAKVSSALGNSEDTRGFTPHGAIFSNGPSVVTSWQAQMAQILFTASRSPGEQEPPNRQDDCDVDHPGVGCEGLSMNHGGESRTQGLHVGRQFASIEDDASVATIRSSIFSDDAEVGTDLDLEPRPRPPGLLEQGEATRSLYVSIPVAQHPSFSETSPQEIKSAGVQEKDHEQTLRF